MNSSHQETSIALTSEENSNITSVLYSELGTIKMTVYLLIMLFSVTGNTLVILSVLLFQKLKTVPNFFIANLAACDLVTTVSSIPFDLAYEELGYWPYGGLMCKILWPLATLSATAAVFTLLSISGDRYGALLHPLNFGNKITKKKCFVIILLGYILAALAVVPYMAFLKYSSKTDLAPACEEVWPDLVYRKAYTVFLFSIQYAIPLPIMAYIYVRLGILLYNSTRIANKLSGEKTRLSPGHHRRNSQISNNSFSSSANANRRQLSVQRRKEQNEKTVKMFFLIVAIFLIFMLPNQILWILYDFGDPELLSTHIDLVAFICRAFTYTNSVLNAVIYGVCNGSFRKAFKAILRCRCGKGYQRDLKRSLTIVQGRSAAANNRRKSPRNSQQKKKSLLSRKPEWSETADVSSIAYDETAAVQCQVSDSTKNTDNSMSPPSVKNYCTKDDSDCSKSRNTNAMTKDVETCLEEAEELLEKIRKDIASEKSPGDSGTSQYYQETIPLGCKQIPKETAI